MLCRGVVATLGSVDTRTTTLRTQIGFAVADIGAAVAELKAWGITFEANAFDGFDPASSIATNGDIRAAWFKDPDGNLLSVVQGASA